MSDNEEDNVQFEDQESINEFGKLNNRLQEVTAERVQKKNDLQKMSDALADLELLLDGKAMLLIGEAFVECDEDFANEYLEKKSQGITEELEGFDSEEKSIKERMDELKKTLYKKFGDSINLEN